MRGVVVRELKLGITRQVRIERKVRPPYGTGEPSLNPLRVIVLYTLTQAKFTAQASMLIRNKGVTMKPQQIPCIFILLAVISMGVCARCPRELPERHIISSRKTA